MASSIDEPATPDDAARHDRIAGVLLGTAAGDALGAGYEFGPPLDDDVEVTMLGGGSFGWGPGEWTDDTSMAVVIAQIAAEPSDVRSPAAQDRIVAAWSDWALQAPDVGIQTREVLAGVTDAAAARASSAMVHERTGRSGGNGSLMRTAPVALAFLHDRDGLIEAATSVSRLTHYDPEAGEACVLWCLAIAHAVNTAGLDIRIGLDALAPDRAQVWRDRIEVAEHSRPADFEHNGWVVEAFQAAWCAIATTPVPPDDPASGSLPADHLQLALKAAVRGGRDTDTVAAIAGGLLGAAHGASAVPQEWRHLLHGWPGITGVDLIALAATITLDEPRL